LKDIVLNTQPGFAQRPGEEEETGATPQIRTHNVSPDGQIDLTGIKYVALPDEESNRYRLKPQDIIFNNTNSEEWVGKTALFEEEGTYVFSNHMTRIQANHQLVKPAYLARYLHFLWQTGYSRQRSKRWVSQAAVDQVTLLEFKIPLPTLPEQQRIIAILRQADSLREKQRQAIIMFDEFLNSIFIEMFCGPQSENWPQETIENLSRNKPNAIRTGPFGSQLLHSEFVNEGIAVLGIDNVVQNFFTWDERRFITKEKYEGLKRYRVFPGDVLITIMGTCGRCAVVPDDIPLSISTKHLCCITLDQKRCLPFYLQACFLNHPKVLR
jgi:type I restriction enzyme S subunit